MALVLVSSNQFDDVRMVNGGQDGDLVLHANDVFFCHLSLRKDFNSDAFSRFSMLASAYCSEGSLANDSFDLVVFLELVLGFVLFFNHTCVLN